MSDDVHANSIRELADRGEWWTLLRYSFAHKLHMPAIDAAIEVLRSDASDGHNVLVDWLDQFRQQPVQPREAPKLESLQLSWEQASSVQLIATFPWLWLCEKARNFPTEQQTSLLKLGLSAAFQAFKLATSVGDRALAAAATYYAARAQQDLNNLESALEGYNGSLSIYRHLARANPDIYLADVAHELNHLGNVQFKLHRFESAVESYQEALATFRQLAKSRPDVYLPGVSMTLNNLGNLLTNLHRFESAVESYEQSLAICRSLAKSRPDVYLPDMATTLNDLSNVQLFLKRFELALESCREALSIRRQLASTHPDLFLPYVATTLNNLGNVQLFLKRFESAVESYQEALSIRRQLAKSRPDVYLPDVAMTLNNLGSVQQNLHRFESAVESYQEALSIRRQLAKSRPDVYLPDVAMTLNNLGSVQQNLHRFESAVESYQEARSIYQNLRERLGTAHLMERISLLRNYARLVLRDEANHGWPDYPLARELLAAASELAEAFRGLFANPAERIRVQHEQQALYSLRVTVCWQCGELYNDLTAYEEALESAEASRARSLLDALSQHIVPAEAPLEMRTEFRRLHRLFRRAQRRVHQEMEILQHLQKADGSAPSPENEDEKGDSRSEPGTGTHREHDQHSNKEDHQDRLGKEESLVFAVEQPRYDRGDLDLSLASVSQQERRIHEALVAESQWRVPFAEIAAELLRFDPEFDPTTTVDSFRLTDRDELFPADKPTAFLHLQIIDNRCMAMLLTPNRVQPLSLPQLSSDAATQMASMLVGGQLIDGLASPDMTALLRSLIPQVLQDLRPAFLETILPTIAAAGIARDDRLVLVPNDVMAFLPLHAVALENGEHLGDYFEVAYTPSLSVLQQCLRRERPEPSALCTIVDPTHSLHGAPALDAKLAARYFDSPVELDQIDGRQLMEQAANANVFYWSGHSQFSLRVPYWSGLLINHSTREVELDGQRKWVRYTQAPEDLATFTEIDCEMTLDECTLAILGGCQSGLDIPGRGNEPVSLVSAFLNAGAKCVLASLWPVDNAACVLTMHRFLMAWRHEGKHIAAALKTAQQWLRALTLDELDRWMEECSELQERDCRDFNQALKSFVSLTRKAHGGSYCPYAHEYYWAPFVAVGQSWER